MTLKKNLGGLDRLVRVVAGCALLYFGLLDPGWVDNQVVRYIMIAFGIGNLLTAAFAFCPMYVPANINTIPKQDH